MFWKKSRLKIFVNFLLFAALFAFLQLSPGRTESNHADFDTFSESYYQLMKIFIRPLRSQNLIQGAMKGMDIALTHLKIAHTMPPLSLTNSSVDNLEAFHTSFGSLLDQLKGKVTSDDLMTDALRGMFESTGDPYTTYLAPKEFKLLSEQMNGGNFSGIGIYIELEKNTKQLMVLEPIDDTPAADAGLKSGDYITAIDGKSTKGIDLDVAQSRIRGAIGSRVTLTIRRKNSTVEKNYNITRAKIRVKSLTAKLKNGDIGYIRLRSFGEFSGQEIEDALRQLDDQGAKAYILDLRNNGGGYIEAAKDVCSKFLPRGAVVVSVVERNGRAQREIADGSEHPDYPMVVLINEFSASASEITAGALQDYKRAKIVGTRSFGKGSVQAIKTLDNRAAAKITIAHYTTPDGRDIDKKGITPDITVSMKGHDFGEPNDEQLQAAIHELQSTLSLK